MKEIYGIILLAAGPSGRLGKPKQLLPYKETTLLQHLIHEADSSLAKDIVVVLGAHEQEIKDALKTENIHTALNNEWKEGVASSIRWGINELQAINPSVDAAILMMCDQPLVTHTLLNDLMTTHEKTGKPIVTCGYDESIGLPVLFHQSIFPELLQLTGDTGVKKIIEDHHGTRVIIPFPGGNINIDTVSDYEALA